MAREKKLTIGAINLTIQPHTPERYVELFKDAYALRRPVNISGDQYGLLSGLMKVDHKQDNLGPLTGDIYRFTNIDKSANWFNSLTNQFASDDEVGKIFIPDHLKPNSSRFSYIFYPKEHLLFYEAYYDGNTFGPNSAERFVERLFNQESIIEKYGKVDVTHIPEINELSEALRIPTKEKIEMVIKRPNPDDHATTEARVMRRMNACNVELYEQNFKATSGQSIEMDADMEAMAHISAKNGSFYMKGKDLNSRPVEFSTKTHPYIVTDYYDPNTQMVFDIFSSITLQLKDHISSWFRR